MYKCVTDTAAVYLSEKFDSSHSCDIIAKFQTNEELVVPKPNQEMFRQSIAYQGPRIWNGLPISVRRAGTIDNFKDMVKPIFKT